MTAAEWTECPLGDDWHDTFVATGYPCCLRCRTHHRSPETCPGIREDGSEADYPERGVTV